MFFFQVLQIVEHAVSPICAGVVQLTKEFGLGTFGPQMVNKLIFQHSDYFDIQC